MASKFVADDLNSMITRVFSGEEMHLLSYQGIFLLDHQDTGSSRAVAL